MRFSSLLQNPVLPLARVVVVGSLALLVVVRLATMERHAPATLVRATDAAATTTIRRGVSMTTPDSAFAQYHLAHGELKLGSHTRVDLIENAGRSVLRFVEGVIVVDGDATLTARDIHMIVHGHAVLTHYSWRDEVDIVPLEGSVEIERPGMPAQFLDPGMLYRTSTWAQNPSIAEFAIPLDPERERLIAW